MKETNCIFCKIANGEIPSKTLYEDDNFRILFELPEETAGEAMKVAKKMADKMMKRLGCEGLNVVQNNGEMAGQTVFHFHMHLIPRYRTDGQSIGWKPQEVSQEELGKIYEQICQ